MEFPFFRTIEELAQVPLGLLKEVDSDLDELNTLIDDNKKESLFYRRLIIRVQFSAIEAYLNILKEFILLRLTYEGTYKIPSNQFLFLLDRKFYKNDKGKFDIKIDFIKAKENVKSTLKLFSQVFKTDKIALGDNEFRLLIELIEKRNSITHPRYPVQNRVSVHELSDMYKVSRCFRQIFNKCHFVFLEWLEVNKRNKLWSDYFDTDYLDLV